MFHLCYYHVSVYSCKCLGLTWWLALWTEPILGFIILANTLIVIPISTEFTKPLYLRYLFFLHIGQVNISISVTIFFVILCVFLTGNGFISFFIMHSIKCDLISSRLNTCSLGSIPNAMAVETAIAYKPQSVIPDCLVLP